MSEEAVNFERRTTKCWRLQQQYQPRSNDRDDTDKHKRIAQNAPWVDMDMDMNKNKHVSHL